MTRGDAPLLRQNKGSPRGKTRDRGRREQTLPPPPRHRAERSVLQSHGTHSFANGNWSVTAALRAHELRGLNSTKLSEPALSTNRHSRAWHLHSASELEGGDCAR